jgi:hypothetical protein
MSEAFETLRQEIEQCQPTEGITSSQMLLLPEGVRRVLNRMMRKGPLTASVAAAEFGLATAEADTALKLLFAKGLIAPAPYDGEETLYRVRLTHTRSLGVNSADGR